MSRNFTGRFDPCYPDAPFALLDEAGFSFSGWCGNRFVGVGGHLAGDPGVGLSDDQRAASLLSRYDACGDDFAVDWGGSFNLVLWDGDQRRLLLYQDPLPGATFMYVAEHEGALYFGNGLRSLAGRVFDGRPRVDRQAIYQFLCRSYLAPPATGFEGVSQLGPGEMVVAEGGRWQHRQTGCWAIPAEKLGDQEACLQEYRRLLRTSIERHATDPDDTVFLLSGGYDSSVNVAVARDLEIMPLRTVGIGSERFSTDAGYARRVAEICGSEHHEYLFDGWEIERLPWLVWNLESPYFEPGMMLTYYALTIARKHGRTVIGGEGTDQLFANAQRRVRPRHRATTDTPAYRTRRRLVDGALRLPGIRGSRRAHCLGDRLFRGLDVNGWSGAYGFRACDLAGWLRPGWHGQDRYDDLAIPDHDLAALLDHACVPVSRDYLLSGILAIYGKLQPQLDVRPISPYLDVDVRRFILSLDPSLRTPAMPGGGFDDKRLHKDLAHQLLPADLFDRPKQGGAISAWSHLEDDQFRAGIMRHLRESEFLSTMLKPGIFDRLEADPRRGAVHTLMLLSLDLWHQLVVERRDDEPPEETLSDMLGMFWREND